MTTLRGLVRYSLSAIRASQAEQRRMARITAQNFRAQQRQLEFENASQATMAYQHYIEMLTSFHKSCSPSVDWRAILSATPPELPIKNDQHYQAAQRKLETYKPSMSERLLGKADKIKESLRNEAEAAKREDDQDFHERMTEYENDCKELETLKSIGNGIQEGEPEAMMDAIRFFNPFSIIREIGSSVEIIWQQSFMDIEIVVHGDEILPDYELNMTSTGKLSKKKIGITRFNELYQDYVCGASIRIAREFFAAIPLDKVRVNVLAKTVDTSTGHQVDLPILSVLFVRNTVDQLNFDRIDPSDSLRNFSHNMKFKKGSGFEAVDRVEV